MEKIRSYAWPGNIRQLVNTVEQLMTLVEEDTIKLKHLPRYLKNVEDHKSNDPSLKKNRVEFEKEKSGWKNSFYGDLHANGKDGVNFYARRKMLTSRH